MSWLNLKRGWIYMLSFLERLSKFNAMYFREFRCHLFLSIKARFAYLGSGKHFSVRHRRYKFKCMVCNCNLCDMNRPIFVPSKYLPVEGTFESSMFICWIWLSIVFFIRMGNFLSDISFQFAEMKALWCLLSLLRCKWCQLKFSFHLHFFTWDT